MKLNYKELSERLGISTTILQASIKFIHDFPEPGSDYSTGRKLFDAAEIDRFINAKGGKGNVVEALKLAYNKYRTEIAGKQCPSCGAMITKHAALCKPCNNDRHERVNGHPSPYGKGALNVALLWPLHSPS